MGWLRKQSEPVRFGRYKKYIPPVIYTDITKAILGDRFLREHKLVYDSDTGTIFDKVSKQTYHTRIKQFCTEIEAAEVTDSQKFLEFINENYPGLLQHDFKAETPKNWVQHRIITHQVQAATHLWRKRSLWKSCMV